MSQEQIDYLKSLGIDTTPASDLETDFPPLKGGYEVEIMRLERRTGSNDFGPFDEWNMGLKIVKTLEGDKGENRWLFKRYNNIAYKSPDEKFETQAFDGSRNAIRDLQVTSGIALQFSAGDDAVTIIDKNKGAVIGKKMYIRTYPKGAKNKQVIIVVNELKIKNPFEGKREEELPF